MEGSFLFPRSVSAIELHLSLSLSSRPVSPFSFPPFCPQTTTNFYSRLVPSLETVPSREFSRTRLLFSIGNFCNHPVRPAPCLFSELYLQPHFQVKHPKSKKIQGHWPCLRRGKEEVKALAAKAPSHCCPGLPLSPANEQREEEPN